MTELVYTYDLEYISNNEYEEPVTEALFEFLTLPCNDHLQTLTDYKIICSDKSETFYCKNSFGFLSIRVRPVSTFHHFEFSLRSKVQRKKSDFYSKQIRVSDQEAALSNPHFYIENFLFLMNSELTKISEDKIDQVLIYSPNQGILDFLQALNAYIYQYIQYKVNVTNVHTSVNDVLDRREGVCQDYTHLFIAMARHNKIPCRYVSGYLNQGSSYIGSAMMHAWAEALVPGIGWVGFDPTNNIMVDEHYVKACHGRDYNDCAPIKGILLTRGENKTSHQVKVAQQ